MDLYKITGSNNHTKWEKKPPKLNSISSKKFDLEDHLQWLIEENTNELLGLEFIKSEFTVDSNFGDELRIDTLCFEETDPNEDNHEGSFVILEYKKKKTSSVVDQGFSYLSVMDSSRDTFINEYCKKKDISPNKVNIDWSQSKIIFIKPSFTIHQRNGVNFKDVPFQLIEYKLFSNDFISFKTIETNTSRNSLGMKGLTGSNLTMDQKKILNEVKPSNEEDLLNGCDKNIRQIWEKIQESILDPNEFIDTDLFPKQYYIRFGKINKKICVFKFRKTKIIVRINGGTEYKSRNTTSKNFFDLKKVDYKKLTTIKKFKWKKNKVEDIYDVQFNIEISKIDEVPYLIELLKLRFNHFNRVS